MTVANQKIPGSKGDDFMSWSRYCLVYLHLFPNIVRKSFKNSVFSFSSYDLSAVQLYQRDCKFPLCMVMRTDPEGSHLPINFQRLSITGASPRKASSWQTLSTAGQWGKKLNLTCYQAHHAENEGKGQSWWSRGRGMLCITSISSWGSSEILALRWKLFPLDTEFSPDDTAMLFAQLF